MNLQIVTPYKPCIYKCPFCCVNSFTNLKATNLLFENANEYAVKLIDMIATIKPTTIVITGNNEPLQTLQAFNTIAKIANIMKPENCSIELQTKISNLFMLDENTVDLIAVSKYEFKDLDNLYNIPKNTTIRYTLLLTKSLEQAGLSNIINAIPAQVSQITFKSLINSNGVNQFTDKWIADNEASQEFKTQLQKEINDYKGKLSIQFDENCMISENRYKVFHSDGHLYDTWGDCYD